MQLSLYLAVEKERIKINAGGFFEVTAGFDQEDNVPWLWDSEAFLGCCSVMSRVSLHGLFYHAITSFRVYLPEWLLTDVHQIYSIEKQFSKGEA